MTVRNHRSEFLISMLVAAMCWASSPDALAGEPPADAPGAKPAEVVKKEKKPDFPPFEKVSKDHEKIPGFFDLYYNKKKDHLLAVVPQSMMGKDFLIASSIAGGPGLAGFMWDTQLVQWQERDKKLVLIEPDPRFNRSPSSTVSDVIARTYTARIVLSTRIVSKLGSDPVIDLDDVFKTDRSGLAGIYGGSVDRSLSKWAETKGFEKNVELAVDLALMGKDSGTRARMHYSLSELPKNDYKPRIADDRVGYFLTAIKNWGKDHSAKTVFDRYIHRWYLRKADPKAEVSDVHPDDQIVYYIEKTVPVRFRRYVREGILLWNAPFEKAGLRNVMAVRQQTDTNEFKDLDPEDVRYNFFRWIVSGSAFAMGPSRVNPHTGQILDADIVWDDALVRSLLSQYTRFAAQGPASSYDPQLIEYLQRHPEWNFIPQEERLVPDSAHYGGTSPSYDPQALLGLAKRNRNLCTLADGLRHEMAIAGFVSEASGHGGLSEEFLGDFIRHVVAHEVGHTLGLRHNFKASSWKSVDELLSAKGNDQPTSASVMDYNAPIYAADLDDQPRFFSPSPGPYDYWAISYGYRHVTKDDESEEEMLAEIASHGNEDGLAYATDEDAGFFSPDPYVNRWDNGSDPVTYAKQRMDMVKRLQKNLADWAVKDGESYSYLRHVFGALLAEYGRAGQFASRMIGGQIVSRNHKGDPGEVPPFQIVPVAKQREALDFLIERVFSDEAFQFSPELLNKLAPGRWRHWASDDYDSLREYPVHDRIAAAQFWALFQLVNPFTLTRIYDAELKVPADQDAITVPEIITRTTKAIWSELTRQVGTNQWTTRKPFISSVRRSLQRSHLRSLINILLTRPGSIMPADAHAVVRTTLKGLSQQIAQTLANDRNGSLDPFTRAHLDEAKSRIDKALDAQFKL